MVFQPVAEVLKQLVMVFKPGPDTESVSAGGIDVHGTFVAGFLHSGVVFEAVGDGWHQVVVTGHEDDDRWCDVLFHLVLCGVLFHQFRVFLSFLTEEIDA